MDSGFRMLKEFSDYKLLNEPIDITIASGAVIKAIDKGTIVLKVKIEEEIRLTLLTRVLYILELIGSLISVLQLQDKGLTITTTINPEKKLLIQYQGVTIGTAYRIGYVYTLEGPDQYKVNSLKAFKSIEAPKQKNRELWHRRLGHLSPGSLSTLYKVTTGLKEPIKGLIKSYEACITSKSIKIINRKASERCKSLLERVYSDFLGPYKISGLFGELYMLTFTDDYTRKSCVYFTKDRKSLRSRFQVFKTRVENETGLKLKILRADNAPEYKALESQMATTGIVFEYTTSYTPEQNGVAERLNRSLISLARHIQQISKENFFFEIRPFRDRYRS
ncbi:hypothetical protein BPAE_1218g00010 [Botrytis paeoniae]|uniref:Integrase catalytic domain-containing protein n=1 Tax=Botrytis paeoniae TaxID=278948 RepID=A0A4Z1EEE5_9HELO|nr:hypothetical protein BPAE_1218g00010 [Botrytis paeoniae]